MFNKKSVFIVLLILVITSVATFIICNKLRRIDKKIQKLSDLTVTSYQIENDLSYFNKLFSSSLEKPINRGIFLSEIKQVKGEQLEIGPYFNPVLKGSNVSYFDVVDRNGLIEKAIVDNVDQSNIPEKIHYVEQYGDMSIINDKFQLVFSSHNIEHQVNLVRHFNQIAELLVKGGKFYLAVPDKRYCFDHFIGVTPVSEVLAIHYQSPKHHSLQTILSKCETTHNVASRHWDKSDNAEPIFVANENCFLNELNNFNQAKGSYIDAHKWRFTPDSFVGIINVLNKMNLISLKVEKVYSTEENSHEFYAVLVKQ